MINDACDEIVKMPQPIKIAVHKGHKAATQKSGDGWATLTVV